jgi:hypothetical protein
MTHLVESAQQLWLLLHTHRRQFTSMPACMLLALRALLRRFLQLEVVQQVLGVAKQLAHVRVTMSSDNELSEQVKFSGQLVTNLSALFGMVRWVTSPVQPHAHVVTSSRHQQQAFAYVCQTACPPVVPLLAPESTPCWVVPCLLSLWRDVPWFAR